MAAVLTALAPEDAGGAAVPEAVLAAFADHARNAPTRQHAAEDGGRRRSGARTPRVAWAATIKAGVVVLAISSGTIAAAAADILPATAQNAAHSLFGSWGVPAPHTNHPSGTVSPSPSISSPAAGASGTATTARPSATYSTSMSPSGNACPDASTRAHCGASAGADSASAAAGATNATKGAEHGHTPTPSPHSATH
ncbi:MAG TPA: hypothetical protein VL551_20350 [Actinospica sp.]|nr:hypothetical protein [Actinospica sp.]